MTTNQNNPAHQSHLHGAVLFVQDFAELAMTDIRGNDLTGCLYSLNRVAIATDSAIETLVIAARVDGTTWQMIGDALSITKQAAQQRYGKSTTLDGRPLTTDSLMSSTDEHGHYYETITTNSRY